MADFIDEFESAAENFLTVLTDVGQAISAAAEGNDLAAAAYLGKAGVDEVSNLIDVAMILPGTLGGL